jgi:hypothetical protein
MIGWVMQKRNVVSIYENGIRYRKFSTAWEDLKSARADKDGVTLVKGSGETVTIRKSISDFERLAIMIRARLL